MVRERVVVALTGGAEGATLLRRGASVAERAGGALLAVHVARGNGRQGSSPRELATQRALVEHLGGSYHVVVGDDVAAALLAFARAEGATQLVLGASRRGRLAPLLGPGTSSRVVRASGALDVHLVTHEEVARGRALPGLGGGLAPGRRLAGALLAAGLLPLLTAVLTATRERLDLGSQLLLYLAAVVAVALVGGTWPALVAAVAAALLGNWFFTAPRHTLRIAQGDDVVALVVFLLVAGSVSALVDLSARRTREAARSRAEAEALATLSGDVLRGESALPALLGRARELFALDEVRLLEGDEVVVARSGEAAPGAPVTVVPAADRVRLELRGRPVAPEELRVLGAFAAQVAGAAARGRLEAQAREAQVLGEVDRLRTALLAAVGHDLHTPLSAAKASVASLRSADVRWSPDDEAELLATAEESLDQLAALVANLLDLSRLQAGVLAVHPQPAALAEALPAAALDRLGPRLVLDVPDDLPELLADPGLLERVLDNLLQNAARHAPAGTPVTLSAGVLGDRVALRVVDHGPGIAGPDRQRVFAPFQRLDDRSSSSYGAGVGLGLAVARGFVEAMGGSLSAGDTPGGGLTMTVTLPLAAP